MNLSMQLGRRLLRCKIPHQQEHEDTEVEEPDSPGGASPTSRWPSMVANRWPSGRLKRAHSAGPSHSRQASLELSPWANPGGFV